MRWVLLVSSWLYSIPCQAQGGNGLQGEYYNGPAFNQKVLVRTDKQIDFSWDGYTLPAPGVSPKSFSVRWTGKLYAPVSGPYKFTAIVDDGMRVWVDGKLAMNEWRYQKQKVYGQAVALKAGQFYDLKIEYYNAGNGGYAQLNWNLVNESGKNPAFENAPQQKVSAQFLYNGPLPKPASPPPPKPVPPPALKQKPVPPAPIVTKKMPGVAPKAIISGLQPAITKPPGLSLAESTALPVAVATDGLTNQQIFFAQSDYQLMPAAFDVLDKVAYFMTRDTTLHLTAEGHTDNVGDSRLNLTLSEYRARVVRTYLCRKGVAEHRITAIGCGSIQSAVADESEAVRAQKRHVLLRFQK
ncbi:PA14 domain-containing protein [Fibrella aquatilis]|uniref:OmpA family protein n=1 Tax=Fibrella aquatilis TaxID=2817059 RepID=A0A939G901_9BACT|nr:PA14 domain-containing protein [Fibrella aquatilis]MBO0934662.1 OmpA family protein [Fibrella aquatilis]